MNRQTKQYHAFLYIFLPSLHDYHKKSPSVPEVIRAAFVNSLLAAASLLTDSGNFLRVAATQLAVYESFLLGTCVFLLALPFEMKFWFFESEYVT